MICVLCVGSLRKLIKKLDDCDVPSPTAAGFAEPRADEDSGAAEFSSPATDLPGQQRGHTISVGKGAASKGERKRISQLNVGKKQKQHVSSSADGQPPTTMTSRLPPTVSRSSSHTPTSTRPAPAADDSGAEASAVFVR